MAAVASRVQQHLMCEHADQDPEQDWPCVTAETMAHLDVAASCWDDGTQSSSEDFVVFVVVQPRLGAPQGRLAT